MLRLFRTGPAGVAVMILLAIVSGPASPDDEVPLPEPGNPRNSFDWGSVSISGPDLMSAGRVVGEKLTLPRDLRASLTFRPAAAIRGRVRHVDWRGGTVPEGNDRSLQAVLHLNQPGEHELTLHVRLEPDPARGLPAQSLERRIRLTVLDVPARDVRVKISYPDGISTPPLDLTGDFRVDRDDLDVFWASYGKRRGEAGYLASTDWDGNGEVDLSDLVRFTDSYDVWRDQVSGPTYGNGLVHPVSGRHHVYAFAIPAPIFRAVTEPAGLESWVSWQVDAEPAAAGTVFTRPFTTPGIYAIRASLPFGAEGMGDERRLTIYRTTITNYVSDVDILEDDVTHTFTATTDPPGYEDYITWRAATKYGTVDSEHGRGPTFDVVFHDTWGADHDFRWLGVQADNDFFNLDEKETKKTVPVRLLRLTGPAGSGVDSQRTPNAAGAAATLACAVNCLNQVYGPLTNVCFSVCDVVTVAIPANTDGNPGDEINANGTLEPAEVLAINSFLYGMAGTIPKGKIVIAPLGNIQGANGVTAGFCTGISDDACELKRSMDNLSHVDDAGDCRTFAHEAAHSFCLCHCTGQGNIMTSPRTTPEMPGEVPNPPAACPNAGTASNELAFSAVQRAEVRRKACDPTHTLCEAMAPPPGPGVLTAKVLTFCETEK